MKLNIEPGAIGSREAPFRGLVGMQVENTIPYRASDYSYISTHAVTAAQRRYRRIGIFALTLVLLGVERADELHFLVLLRSFSSCEDSGVQLCYNEFYKRYLHASVNIFVHKCATPTSKYTLPQLQKTEREQLQRMTLTCGLVLATRTYSLIC